MKRGLRCAFRRIRASTLNHERAFACFDKVKVTAFFGLRDALNRGLASRSTSEPRLVGLDILHGRSQFNLMHCY